MNLIKLLVVFIILTLNCLNSNSQKKKIYLAPDDHTDYMWSGNEEEYRDAFLKTIDYYLKVNDSTAGEPYAYQNKWNCDGSLWVYEYEKNRDEIQFKKLIDQIRNGKITVPLNTIASVHGIAPLEVTIRDMYYAGYLERKFGLDLDLTINMEDQVLPLGLSSLYAGSGAKYSWRGVCACATKVSGLENRLNEIYWYQGLDDQRVLMKWYSVNPSMISNRKEYRYYLGTYLESSNPANAITDCKALMNNNKKYPYNIAAAFGKGGDDLMTITNKFPKTAKENSDADYQIIVSNELDFFREFEREYGDVLPTETVSYGSTEWGNSIASLAEVSATIKRAAEKLRAAELMFTLSAMKDETFASGLKDKREKAWIACGLYFEHDWTADGPIISRKQRADWQRKIAAEFTSYVDTLHSLSLAKLAGLIRKTSKSNESFFVLNPLGWERSDYCDYPYNGKSKVNIIDMTTGKEVPFQFMTKKNTTYIRIFASGIPSLGYKVFEIRNASSSAKFDQNVSITDSIIENNNYRIRLNRQGAIISLTDKDDNNYEYINSINNLFANDLGHVKGKKHSNMKVENSGPVSITLTAESYWPVKHITKLTLFGNTDRIEIENFIKQNLDASPVTYSFSFNFSNPEIWHEEAGAILKARPQSMGGHYADSICRLDWIGINHFAEISDGDHGIIISNRDAYFMKPGNSTVTSLDCITPQINILAAGQIDAPGLGIVNQDGDSYFENFFALKINRNGFNPSSAMMFSMEHQNPLIAGKLSNNKGQYGTRFSLFSVSDPNVIICSVKPAEEGINNGIVLRAWNMSNKNISCTLSSVKPVLKSNYTTHIETNREPVIPVNGELLLTMGHNRIQTLRIFLEK
jgi:alpha-mannosidase